MTSLLPESQYSSQPLGLLPFTQATVIVCVFSHLANAEYPTVTTLSGMEISVIPVQPSNVLSPMLVTLSGIVIDASDVQSWNA